MSNNTIIDGVDKNRSACVFIEFQAEWLATDGILFQRLVQDKDAFCKAVEQAGKVLASARKNDLTVAHAGLDMRNDPTYNLFAKGKNVFGLRGAIPKAGTWTGRGAEFVAPFVPLASEFVVSGRSGASVLKNSNLDPFLRNNRIDTIFIMGFATHVCVESTLRDAHDNGLNVYVVTDACAAFNTAQDDYFKANILHHFGAGIDAASLVKFFESK